MVAELIDTKRTVTRRRVLAFSAAGAVTAALAACGEAAGVPTVAPTTAPPAAMTAPTTAAPRRPNGLCYSHPAGAWCSGDDGPGGDNRRECCPRDGRGSGPDRCRDDGTRRGHGDSGGEPRGESGLPLGGREPTRRY